MPLNANELQIQINEVRESLRIDEVEELLQEYKEQKTKKENALEEALGNKIIWSLSTIHFCRQELNPENRAKFALQQHAHIPVIEEQAKKIEQYEKDISILDDNIAILEAALIQMEQAEMDKIEAEVQARIQQKHDAANSIAKAALVAQPQMTENSASQREKQEPLVVNDENIEPKPFVQSESPAMIAKKPQSYGIINFSLSQRKQQVPQKNPEAKPSPAVSQPKPIEKQKPRSALGSVLSTFQNITLFQRVRVQSLNVQEQQQGRVPTCPIM